jgi:hypothetical protein
MTHKVRNWWVSADIDGRPTPLAAGPIKRDGGIYVVVTQRHAGAITPALTIIGTAVEDGTLRLEVLNAEGQIIFARETTR